MSHLFCSEANFGQKCVGSSEYCVVTSVTSVTRLAVWTPGPGAECDNTAPPVPGDLNQNGKIQGKSGDCIVLYQGELKGP